MSKLTHSAEILKLAHQIHVDAGDLQFMERVDTQTITLLREHISNRLFDRHGNMFQRIASSSRLLPMGILTVIAQKAIGPFLCAQIAGHMPTDRAIEMAGRLSVPFMADICKSIDPRRVGPLLQGMPATRILEVAIELIRRRDYISMGRFVGYLPDATLNAVLNAINDDHALLQTAFYIENKATLNHIIGMLPETRIRSIINAANTNAMWPEALALMTFVNQPLSRLLGDLAVQESDQVLAGMVKALHDHDLWPEILPIVAWLSEPSQQRFINLPESREPEVLARIIQSAQALDLWKELLPLMRHYDAEGRNTLTRLAMANNQQLLNDIIDAARRHNLWLTALDLVHEFAEDHLAEVALALARQTDASLASFLKAISQGKRWDGLISLADRLSPKTREYLVTRGFSEQGDFMNRLLKAAEDAGVWDEALVAMTGHAETLLTLVQQLPENMQKSLVDDCISANPQLLDHLLPLAWQYQAWELATRLMARSTDSWRAQWPEWLAALPIDVRERVSALGQQVGLSEGM